MKPTIYTVAEAAGVSIATVSRAFNNSPRINEATRERILRIAREVGFQPNASARSLALNATQTLALVFPQVSGPYFSEFIRGAENVARQHQYHLLVYSSSVAGEDDPLLPLLSTRTDGMILGTRLHSTDFVHQLHRRRFPFLLLGESIPGLAISGLHPENERGARELVDHLIEKHRCRRIAFISGPDDRSHSGERLRGCCQAVEAHGVPWLPELVVPGNFDEASGYAAARQLLNLPVLPDALIAANDQMAIGAMAAAAERGLRIPHDLAVAGFDDIPSARYLQPSLTTVNLSIYEQGARAVELLLERIADPDLPPKVIPIASTLVIRRSCGCEET